MFQQRCSVCRWLLCHTYSTSMAVHTCMNRWLFPNPRQECASWFSMTVMPGQLYLLAAGLPVSTRRCCPAAHLASLLPPKVFAPAQEVACCMTVCCKSRTTCYILPCRAMHACTMSRCFAESAVLSICTGQTSQEHTNNGTIVSKPVLSARTRHLPLHHTHAQ